MLSGNFWANKKLNTYKVETGSNEIYTGKVNLREGYETKMAFEELERGIHAALETYSNVHRGSGHFSMATTQLYEYAREIVLEYLGLKRSKYVVIFCTTGRANALMAQLNPESYKVLTSHETGLSLGVSALVINRKSLPKGAPIQSGGGTTRLVAPTWVIWANDPDKFEAGTPAIINAIAFAKALLLIKQYGVNAFRNATIEKLTVTQILYSDEFEASSGQKLLIELRKKITGSDISVPSTQGAIPFINLDNAASTPAFLPVWKTACLTLRQPGSMQKEIINEVKSICARFLDAPSDFYDVIFTSNTTEAINLAAEILNREPAQPTETVVLNTLLEHNSNDLPWRMIPGVTLIRINSDPEGFIDLNELDNILGSYNRDERYGQKRIKIVAVSGASNVLGVFNDLYEISRIVHKYNARLLVDAAQMLAHRRIEMDRCNIDFLAFSAHKAYAPFGTGALIVRKGLLNFEAHETELIKSSGEENAAGIAALGKALLLLERIGPDVIRNEEQTLTSMALAGLAQIKGLTIYGIKDHLSPRFAGKGGVIVFNLKGIMPNKVAKQLAVRGGIGVRYGCHCSHLLIKHLLNVPPALEKFQGIMLRLFPGIALPGVVRVSIGIGNSEKDIERLIKVLRDIASDVGPNKNKTLSSAQEGTNLLSDKEVRQQIKEFVSDVKRRVYYE